MHENLKDTVIKHMAKNLKVFTLSDKGVPDFVTNKTDIIREFLPN